MRYPQARIERGGRRFSSGGGRRSPQGRTPLPTPIHSRFRRLIALAALGLILLSPDGDVAPRLLDCALAGG